ncbi:MAG: glycosyltransferase family A protein [bacterium]
MKVSILIPAYNEEKYIGRCLESIQKNCSNVFEVIVVNNASTDNTKSIVESFAEKSPFIRVVDEPKKGLPFARNRGLAEATGDIVAYMDSDCIVPPQWYERIIKEFESRENLVSLSGPYRYYDLPLFWNLLAQIGWWVSAPIAHFVVGYTVLLGNVAVRKNILVEAGGLNENVMFYGDDTDLARRLSVFGKVDFKMSFFILSSSRRLRKEGLFKAFAKYALNFVWEVIFKRPFTHEYENIR